LSAAGKYWEPRCHRLDLRCTTPLRRGFRPGEQVFPQPDQQPLPNPSCASFPAFSSVLPYCARLRFRANRSGLLTAMFHDELRTLSSHACPDSLQENIDSQTALEARGERPPRRATAHSSATRPLQVGAPRVPIHCFLSATLILFHWSRFRRRPRPGSEGGKRARGHRIDGLVKALAEAKSDPLAGR